MNLKKRVSILVFLELALRLEDALGEYVRETGFNPCFPGTRSSTVSLQDLGGRHFEFQSLFSWNSLFDSGLRPRISPLSRVSILVFLELALRLGRPMRYWNMRRKRFNPCFPGTRSSTLRSFSMSLMIGSRVSILVFLELALRPCNTVMREGVFNGFQSLFSWNSLFDFPMKHFTSDWTQVSILVFLELALRL